MLSLSWDMYVSFPGAMLVEAMWGAFQCTIFSSGRSAWLGHFWLLLKRFWDSRPHSLWWLQSLHLMASLCGHQIASSKWPTTIFISTMGISLYIVAATKSESLSSLFLSLSHKHTQSLFLLPTQVSTMSFDQQVCPCLWEVPVDSPPFTCLGMRRAGVCVCVGISTFYNGKDVRLITHSSSAHHLEYSVSWELDWW